MGTWVWESRSANLFGLVRPPTPRMAVNPVRLGGLEGPNGLKMGGFGPGGYYFAAGPASRGPAAWPFGPICVQHHGGLYRVRAPHRATHTRQ